VRIAAVDVGSNSTRLLVADITASGNVVPVARDLQTTRLGRGMGGGRLLAPAMESTLRVIKQFVDRAERAGAAKIVIAATSAVRDAANRDDFASAVRAATGLELQVLSGIEEARLSYLGVTGALGDYVQNTVVVDIGGGSTEFIWCPGGRARFFSVNAGAVRMTENGYGRGQIKSALEPALQSIRRDILPGEVVGVGGTVTTLAAVAQGLRRYDPEKVHGYRLSRQRVDELYYMLQNMPLAARKELPGLQPERADIIPAGTRILSRILHGLGTGHVLVSEADILYGLVMEAKKMS